MEIIKFVLKLITALLIYWQWKYIAFFLLEHLSTHGNPGLTWHMKWSKWIMKSLPFISIDFSYDKIHQCAKEHLPWILLQKKKKPDTIGWL